MSTDEVTTVVNSAAATLAAQTITVTVGDRTLSATATDLGVMVDVEATVERVTSARKSSVPFVGLAKGLFGSSDVAASLRVDGWPDRALTALPGSSTEPAIIANAGHFSVVPGTNAPVPDLEVLEAAIAATEWSGQALAFDTPAKQVPPAHSTEEVTTVVGYLNAVVDSGLIAAIGDYTVTVPGTTVATWVATGSYQGSITLDESRVIADVAELFDGVLPGPVDAGFERQGESIAVRGEAPGYACCAPGAAAAFSAAIGSGQLTTPVALEAITVAPERDTAELNALGITDIVGQFTTKYPCCPPRVTNIKRFSELLSGTIIGPGERLSVNKAVGERTEERGFVPAPAIADGELADQVGGGSSQVATTLFNAAFFAGLEIPVYQSHSLAFSRYPYGREATINWPKPDLVIKNPTPYGVLIWVEATDTSITVTLYSTKVWASVEQTDQVIAPDGDSCTVVTTERTRVSLDGKVETDLFRARYRAEEGLNCDETATTTTLTPPPTEAPASTTGQAPATTATTAPPASTTDAPPAT